MSMMNGPLCEEPVEGVAIIIDDIRFTYSPLSLFPKFIV